MKPWRCARSAVSGSGVGLGPAPGAVPSRTGRRRPRTPSSWPAEAFGLGVLGFSPLGGGLLTGKYRRGATGRAQSSISQFLHKEDDPAKAKILVAVESVARDLDATPERVAIKWSMSKGVIPIVGPRSVDQLTSNLAAGDLDISTRQLEWLDEVSAPQLGYPHEMWSEHERVEKNRFAQP